MLGSPGENTPVTVEHTKFNLQPELFRMSLRMGGVGDPSRPSHDSFLPSLIILIVDWIFFPKISTCHYILKKAKIA